MQGRFAFGWDGEKFNQAPIGQRQKIESSIQGKQIILANSLEVVRGLMNFNAGYQLESKQFKRNQGALQR